MTPPCGEPCSACAPATLARVLGNLSSTWLNADGVRDQWMRMREAHGLTCTVTYAISNTKEHYVTLIWWVEAGDDERQHELKAYGQTSLAALAGVLSKPEAWAHDEVEP